MRSVGVVVGDDLAEDHPQVLFIDDDQVVETLAPQGANDSLGQRIRARGPDRSEESFRVEHVRSLCEVRPISMIAIPDEIARCPAPARGLEKLTSDPTGRRMSRHMEVHEFAPAMSEEDERVECLEGQGLDGEEVGDRELRR